MDVLADQPPEKQHGGITGAGDLGQVHDERPAGASIPPSGTSSTKWSGT